MTDCQPCPAATVAPSSGVSAGGGGGGGPGIEPASDAARRSLVLKNGISCDDCPVCVLSAVVRPGHPGSSGISGDETGSLVHRTGVPIPFPSELTWQSRGTGPVQGRFQRRKNRRGRAQFTSASSERRPLEVRVSPPAAASPPALVRWGSRVWPAAGDIPLIERLDHVSQFSGNSRRKSVQSEFEDCAFVGHIERIAERAAATTGKGKSRTMGYPRPLAKGLSYRAGPQSVSFKTSGCSCELAGTACEPRLGCSVRLLPRQTTSGTEPRRPPTRHRPF